ncbi:hypothetical protein BDV59DRAFT_196081 [Aspergillus ambiguus]|uniref:uncharacterized protein n=1 Tax=Aspergillus ambiguus TaxID=176160 RepID=UPI003CCD6F42
MCRSPNHPEFKALQVTLFKYRGLAIRSLNDEIKEDSKHKQTLLLAGILSLLHVDGFLSTFRLHLEGARRIIMGCNGVRSIINLPGMIPVILDYIFLVTMGDTSSPTSKLLVGTLPIEDIEFLISEYGGSGFAFRMCPPPLLVEVLKINQLRNKASRELADCKDLRCETFELLCRLNRFSAEEWIMANDALDEDFKHVVNMFQATVSLYCISSLQDCKILPESFPLSSICLTLRDLVYELVRKVLACFGVAGSGCLVWPLMVLGVQAVGDGCREIRRFVCESLTNQGLNSGTYAPLALREVLEAFWASGKTGWGSCFNKPAIFTALITVNCGGIPYA